MSPARNGNSEIQLLMCSDTIEICVGIIFNFYTGLPRLCLCSLQCIHASSGNEHSNAEIPLCLQDRNVMVNKKKSYSVHVKLNFVACGRPRIYRTFRLISCYTLLQKIMHGV